MHRYILLFLFSFSASHAGVGLSVEGAWVPEPIPGSSMMAGYLKLKNTSHKLITITGASSDSFAEVQMHRSLVEDGMAKMKMLKTIDLKAGSSLVFKSGSYHLMLISAKRELKLGDQLKIVLRTKSKKKISFSAVVKKRPFSK